MNLIEHATPGTIQLILQGMRPAENRDYTGRVLEIGLDVRKRGDEALRDFAQQFDKATLTNLVVQKAEIESALTQVSPAFTKAIQAAHRNITQFHQNQVPQNWRQTQENGTFAGVQYRPLDYVGLYVPGGRASYPSTVLMNAIPAAIAGVRHTVMATPPRPDGTIAPELLAAADLCGVHTIIKSGGAQAVFALAYGTQSVPKVDKIVGPGNVYVTLAKQQVYGQVDIDKPAGPSEVLVAIEDPRYASFAAAELLAQLEHDPEASAVALSTRRDVLQAVQAAVQTQLPSCARQEILAKSCQNAHFLLAETHLQVIESINALASEHLVLLVDNAESWLPDIRHAGSIFLGPYTPVTLGDYFAGPNHVLPTAGAARFASPLNVMDFMKFSAYLSYTLEALKAVTPDLEILTNAEGFDAHLEAVKIRTQGL